MASVDTFIVLCDTTMTRNFYNTVHKYLCSKLSCTYLVVLFGGLTHNRTNCMKLNCPSKDDFITQCSTKPPHWMAISGAPITRPTATRSRRLTTGTSRICGEPSRAVPRSPGTPSPCQNRSLYPGSRFTPTR